MNRYGKNSISDLECGIQDVLPLDLHDFVKQSCVIAHPEQHEDNFFLKSRPISAIPSSHLFNVAVFQSWDQFHMLASTCNYFLPPIPVLRISKIVREVGLIKLIHYPPALIRAKLPKCPEERPTFHDFKEI